MLNEMILWNYWGSWNRQRQASVRIRGLGHTAAEEAAFERRMAAARITDKTRLTPAFVVTARRTRAG